jgi:DNA-binding response OmpR family regulator
MAKLLIVEDEKILRETLAYNLINQGFEVLSAEDGQQALTIFDAGIFDVVILDIMLPGIDGFEVCRKIRQNSNVPILMLTARDDEIDRVVGLEVGADDYMVKPFSMRELIARIKAMLRRVRFLTEEKIRDGQPSPVSLNMLTHGNLVIDVDRQEVRLNDTALELKPKEYELLLYMAQNIGKALPRERILEQVWGWEYIGESRTVDVHVRWLRQKIEEIPEEPKRLITVRGTGYRFEG